MPGGALGNVGARPRARSGSRPRRAAPRARFAAVERHRVRVEGIEALARRGSGGRSRAIVEHGAVDEAREVAAPDRVGHRRHAEAERRGEARVARERPAPAHREDVQPVAGAREDLAPRAREELAQQRARRVARRSARWASADSAARSSRARTRASTARGIVAARGGEAPRADRGADEVAHARLRRAATRRRSRGRGRRCRGPSGRRPRRE